MKLLRTIILALLVILFFLGSDTVFSSEKISKILILPFNMRTEKDLAFLQKGIEEMLSTRLADESKVVITEKQGVVPDAENLSSGIDEKTALALGEKADADYVLFGSLTVFGESISTDAKFYDVHTKSSLVVFSKTGNTPEDVINHIDGLAAKINESVSGQKTFPKLTALSSSKPISTKPMPVKKPAINNNKNPEELWEEENKSISTSNEKEDKTKILPDENEDKVKILPGKKATL